MSYAPSSPYGYRALGIYLVFADRAEEGVSYLNRALRLSPSPRADENISAWVGVAYFSLGQLDKAIDYIKKVKDIFRK